MPLPDATLPHPTPPDARLPDATLPHPTPPDATLPDATLRNAMLPHPTPPDATLPNATLPNATLPNATLADPMLPRTPLPDWVGAIPAEIAYPTVFVTISGAHLYGFASVDSDVDLRGVHILPLPEVVGLRHGPQTLKRGGVRDGVELDLVTHDLAMFLGLLLKPNGYVLEQLLSPLVVQTSGLHAELVALAPGCLTRHHSHHYRGFANGQWKLFESTGELKPALYTLRVLLTGIHLMRTGEVVADLRQLYGKHQLPYVSELIEAKTTGEHRLWTDMASRRDRALLARDVARLHATLAQAAEQTDLPPRPSTYDALHDLLLRTRLS